MLAKYHLALVRFSLWHHAARVLQAFSGEIVDHKLITLVIDRGGQTVLIRLEDHSIWQSSNEGYTWTQLFPDQHFLGFYHHKYSDDRAYLVTNTDRYYYTVDGGQSWHERRAPTPPNSFSAPVLRFHPNTDLVIWTGNRDCSGRGEKCHAEAQYSRNNGASWNLVDGYVRNCAWAKDAELDTDPHYILCESYKNKRGSQHNVEQGNPLELIGGTNFYQSKQKIFDDVVGFAKFSEFLVVAQVKKIEWLVSQVLSVNVNFY